ncbi:LysM peptidoglycan-binding domain-containing protein [Gottfriedia luciferensis]|uniref:LysM peptidoglycan-binding domain-containing protein n=1 Tax=Gottfriedia luciferensis TaxID=178774 RepID=UPI000B443546|nr:LysM peptidoglycan-binding domain-containing protein [Gottfriedia luciferensis]
MKKKLQDESTSGLSRKIKNKKNQRQSEDILNLPPRSESIKRKEDERRPWWKLKYPLITILVLIFILLPFGVVKFVDSKYDKIFTEKGSLIVPSNKFEKVKIATTEKSKKNDNNNQVNPPLKNTNKNEENPIKNSSETEGVKETTHQVQRGETLFTISMKYYGNRDGEEIIQDANHLESIQLTPGQILKIPLNVDMDK